MNTRVVPVVEQLVHRMVVMIGQAVGPQIAGADSNDPIKQWLRDANAWLAAAPEQAQPKVDWSTVNRVIDEYVGGYEFRGDGGDHTPTESEAILILDAIHGLLEEEDFLKAFRASEEPEQAQTPSQRMAEKGYTPRHGVGPFLYRERDEQPTQTGEATGEIGRAHV
jgi:hypothetical protein